MKDHIVAHLKKALGNIPLWGITLSGAFLRLVRIGEPSLWYDELYTVRVSRLPLSSVIPETLAERDPPFYHLALHFWNQLGSGDAWVRLLSAGAGIASIWLVYALGRDLFSRRAGLWAAAFTAFSPFLVWYSRDATDYSMAIATAMASLYFLAKAAQRGGRLNWAIYVTVSAAALFTHYYNAMFLLAEVPFFLLLQKRHLRLRSWFFCQSCLGLALLPWLLALVKSDASQSYIRQPLNLFSLRSLLDGLGTAPIAFVRGYAGRIGRGEGALGLTAYDKLLLAVWLLTATGLLLAAYRFGRFTSKRNLVALAVLIMLATALPVLAQLAQGSLIAARYYAVAAPLFLLAVAAIIDALPVKAGWAVGGLFLLLLISFLNVQRQHAGHEDWRGIMNTVAAESRSGDELLCFPFHHCIVAQDHYGGANLEVKGGMILNITPQSVFLSRSPIYWRGYRDRVDTDQIYDSGQLKRQIASNLGTAERTWLISGSGILGNYPRAMMVEEAMSGEWSLVQKWEFTPLTLKLYERKEE